MGGVCFSLLLGCWSVYLVGLLGGLLVLAWVVYPMPGVWASLWSVCRLANVDFVSG